MFSLFCRGRSVAIINALKCLAAVLLSRRLAGLVLGWILLYGQPSDASGLRGNLGIHDPSTIIKCKDRYYIFGTGAGIITKWSTDKIFWNAGPNVFTNAPTWTTNAVPGFGGVIWAPDVFFLNGRYCVYFAISTFGSQVSAIGLVTSPTLDPADPTYHWTDQGIVIQSSNGSAYNTIDPSVMLDASGNPWMSFGSYWSGIYTMALDPQTGLRLLPNSTPYRVAYNGSIEASCLFRRGGYYYLFADWGSCCSGVNSTYNVRMGRSASPSGPFLDRNGVDMVANGGTLFLQGTGKFTGPGHVGILSEGGNQSFSYHYYDAGAFAPWYNAYGPADFDLEPLSWTPDDWPVFTNDWSAVYRFKTDARDENGQYYGVLLNGASIQSEATRGRVLNLNGTNQYVQLPPGTAFARTFSAVIKWNGGGAWQRIFDFGVDTSRYVMLTPSSGNGKLRCDIRANGVTQVVEGPNPVPIGAWTHVALTLDGSQGILYMNGLAVATNTTMNLSPLDVLAQTNHLGHSKFVADPDFNGQIADFRVYGRALSAAELRAPQPVITQPSEGETYWPGSIISLSGQATDFTALDLSVSSLTWRVEYSQFGQTNVVLGPLSGVSHGNFLVPTNATSGGSYRIFLTATDAGGRTKTTSLALLPANPPAGWSSLYPFVNNANDAKGHFNGTLNGGASFVNDAARGAVLNLSGTNQFVSLPVGVTALQTFMAWVKWNGGNAWQRIFDLGNDTTHYSVLTPSAANGKLRFNITVNGIPGEQIIDAPGPLPVGVWTHVAVTLDGNTGILYTNGVAVATNAAVNLVPANLGATNNFLGKSQFPDPYFSGRLSAVRLYPRALSAAEIVAPRVDLSQPAPGAIYPPGATVNFAGSASDFYEAAIAPTGLTWSVQFCFAGVTNTILGPLSGTTNGTFNIPASGSSSTNGFYRILLTAADGLGRRQTNSVDIFPAGSALSATNWSAFYPLTNSAADSGNRYNGTLINGASIQVDLTRGRVVNLSGASQYVNLPAGAGAAQSFGGWVKWNGGAAWQRIFDFGVDTTRWVMLTPLDGSGRMQSTITTDSGVYGATIQAPSALPVGVWTHVAVVFDGRQGILYTNGVPMAVNNSVNLLPADVVATHNYLGRSQFPADAYFNGRLDALQLSSLALSPNDLFAPAPVILQPASGGTYAGGDSIAYSGAAYDFTDAPLPASAFSWAVEFMHDGAFTPWLGPWNGVTNGSFQIPTSGSTTTNASYRLSLTVTDGYGNRRSTSTELVPRFSQLSLATVPPGLPIALDGQTVATPITLPAVVGLVRTLSAPATQTMAGSNYNFTLWSDAGAMTHGLTVPSSNTTYTAAYVSPALSVSGPGTNLFLSWPTWAGNLGLFRATNLASPVTWEPVGGMVVTSNAMNRVVVPGTNLAGFYRLQLR